jgi:hypothetical protein
MMIPCPIERLNFSAECMIDLTAIVFAGFVRVLQ